jgi:cytochrome c oxidase subunit 2
VSGRPPRLPRPIRPAQATVRPGRRRFGRLARGIGLLLIGGAVAGCMPAPATTQGQQISDLYRAFVVAGVGVAFVVWGLVTWSLIRYRRRDERLPVQTLGSVRIEVVWTAIPLLIVLVLFGLTMRTLASVDAREPSGIDLHVTAFRWQWAADYPASGVHLVGTTAAALEVVLPVDTPIHVTLSSLDVNHAFFVPKFLFKRDAIPGRPTTFDLRITDPGIYPGQCAEFCGVGHGQMLFTIRAVDPATFQAWLAGQAASASAAP